MRTLLAYLASASWEASCEETKNRHILIRRTRDGFLVGSKATWLPKYSRPRPLIFDVALQRELLGDFGMLLRPHRCCRERSVPSPRKSGWWFCGSIGTYTVVEETVKEGSGAGVKLFRCIPWHRPERRWTLGPAVSAPSRPAMPSLHLHYNFYRDEMLKLILSGESRLPILLVVD